MILNGRTITHIDEDLHGVELLIHFTDGDTLRIKPQSYDDADLNVELLHPEDKRREAHQAQGHRETKRLRRLITEGQAQERDTDRALQAYADTLVASVRYLPPRDIARLYAHQAQNTTNLAHPS